MPDSELTRLFLSYGRTDASELAEKLAADLRTHSLADHGQYDTWRDRLEIKSGQPWTEIAAALRSTAGMIAILTPHAVRTRSDAPDASDSVCLDEISYARFAAKKPIVPAMAIPCEPPFEILTRTSPPVSRCESLIGGGRQCLRRISRHACCAPACSRRAKKSVCS